MTYTSIEQSKQLMELGLNPDSADMSYSDESVRGTKYTDPFAISLVPYKEHKQFIENINTKKNICCWTVLPCWSAECLLNLLPTVIKTGDKPQNWYQININKDPYQISYGNNLGSSGSWHDMVSSSQSWTFVDAVCSMMKWVLEKQNNKELLEKIDFSQYNEQNKLVVTDENVNEIVESAIEQLGIKADLNFIDTYTNIEQSKKLLELGLNPYTADMHYLFFDNKKYRCFASPYRNIENSRAKTWAIPCWSVGALIDLLPSWINILVRDNDNLSYYTDSFLRMNNISVSYKHFDETQEMYVSDIEFITSSDFMECLYNMIVWLLENNCI